MKKQEIDRLEESMRKAFCSGAEFIPPQNWRELVMVNVRRNWYAKPRIQPEDQTVLPLRLMWRLSAALVIVAVLVCITLYISFPAQTATAELVNNIPYDSFDKYIITVAQL
ncbi:MAG: hypothetical protein PHV82_14640 [Victivallaceae bacterium]|nr:hypothetical protein [Victivallaceae bacterium]